MVSFLKERELEMEGQTSDSEFLYELASLLKDDIDLSTTTSSCRGSIKENLRDSIVSLGLEHQKSHDISMSMNKLLQDADNAIDISLDSEVEDGDVEFNETDMNDHRLLIELENIQNSLALEAKNDDNLSIEKNSISRVKGHKIIDDSLGNPSTELKQADKEAEMQSSLILSKQSIQTTIESTFENMESDVTTVYHHDRTSFERQENLASTLQPSSFSPENAPSLIQMNSRFEEDMIKTTDFHLLETYIKMEQQRAVSLKKLDEKENALIALRNSKMLKARLAQLQVEEDLEVIHQQKYHESIETLRKRMLEYKEDALQQKSKGNLTKAKESLKMFDQLKSQLDEAKANPSNFEKIINMTMTAAHRKTDLSSASSSTEKLLEKNKSFNNTTYEYYTQSFRPFHSSSSSSTAIHPTDIISINSFDTFKEILNHQLDLCVVITNDLIKKEKRHEATDFQKRKRDYLKTLESAEGIMKHFSHASEIFVLKERVKYFKPCEDTSIPINKMRCRIDSIKGIEHITKEESPPSTFLIASLEWPDGSEPQRYTSHTVKSSYSPDFSWVLDFTIEKSKKFTRFVERKKLIVQLYAYKGLFRKNTLLAKLNVPLSSLENSNEISISTNMLSENKIQLPVQITGKITLRVPLNDFSTTNVVEENWIIANERVLRHQKTLKEIHRSARHSHQDSKNNNSSLKLKDGSNSNHHHAQDEESFYDPFLIPSEKVLNNEIIEMENFISALKVKEGAERQANVFQERKNNYEIQKNFIICQVEAGILNIKEYESKLKEYEIFEKKRTLKLKKSNMELTKRGLIRLRWLKEEFNELKNVQ